MNSNFDEFNKLMELAISQRYTQREIATKLGVDESYISGMKNGKRKVTGAILEKFKSFVHKNMNNDIFANVPVSAGMLDKNYFTDRPGIENIQLPIKFPFPTVTLPISGDSMTPRLRDGDFVICRKLESANEIKDGHLYVIQTKRDGMTCKFLSKENEALRLWSANPAFKPFDMAFDDVLALYEVLLKIAKA